jgi:predicted amidohydrolase/GNAT superfamily N-acetyltransferase
MKNEPTVEIAQLDADEYEQLREAMVAAYPNWGGNYWKRSTLERLINTFPEGQLAVYMNGKIVGCALSIIVDYDKFGDNHTYEQITGSYTFETHSKKGSVLYGIEVFVHPEARGLHLGRRLYDARKELAEKFNLRSIIFGGRIPNYHKYADQMTPKEYIQKVKYKEIYDPVLSFQISNDFHVRKVLKNYLPEDTESAEYGTLMEWINIYYDPQQLNLRQNSTVRLGLVQWQMRPYRSSEELNEQLDYFAEVVSGYKCDFMLLPELFNAPLMSEYNSATESDAIRAISKHTEPIRKKLSDLAVKFNVNIIGGSMPEMRDEHLYNIGYLLRRDGTYESYEKIHITPNELKYWGMKGGDKVQVFDTDCGRIGILICYDVEFPELARIMAMQDMEILFVPFLTDTQNAYSRVRNCAQARAIENECYVAIAGSIGNLPKVKNMDIQYAQSMVFTPCDFPFPSNGVKGEATTNTEMVLIVDVDLDLLKEIHEFGSVRTKKDRRTDLYDIKLLEK